MLYTFLKYLVGFSLQIYYKKIYVKGAENIRQDKAQIIASNHPNGFLEPLIMACFLPKPLYFLVRGDVFKNPVASFFLRATNQIPIYRFRDGFSKLRHNSKTMDESQKVLSELNNLLIFAEGGTQSIKKLRPLQKGMARIAFQTLDHFPELDLEILPAGINFTYPEEFDEEVMLKIGKPISVRPYYDLYLTDKNSGTEALLNAVYDAMKNNVIHLDNSHLSSLFENTVPAVRAKHSYPYLPVLVKNDDRLQTEKNWATALDRIPADDIHNLKSSLDSIQKKYKKWGLTPRDIHKKPLQLSTVLVLIIGSVPALAGIFFHIIPVLAGRHFKKNIVRQKEFKASVQFAVTVFLALILYVALLIAGFFVHQILLLWWIPVVCGLWARYYYFLINNTAWKKPSVLKEYISEYRQWVDSDFANKI